MTVVEVLPAGKEQREKRPDGEYDFEAVTTTFDKNAKEDAVFGLADESGTKYVSPWPLSFAAPSRAVF